MKFDTLETECYENNCKNKPYGEYFPLPGKMFVVCRKHYNEYVLGR